MVDDVWEERGRETASGCVQVHYDIPLIIFPNVQGWEEDLAEVKVKWVGAKKK
jgi:hypothetical protein